MFIIKGMINVDLTFSWFWLLRQKINTYTMETFNLDIVVKKYLNQYLSA